MNKQNKVFEAIRFAAIAHEGHYRKGSNIPYIAHLTNVMKTLCLAGCDDDTIIAGILHDTVEDTSVTIEEIRETFGENVAKYVAGATEESKLNKNGDEAPWRERKELSINAVKTSDCLPKLMVSCADKLDNVRDIRRDYEVLGDDLWTRFNASKSEQLWYYNNMADAFLSRAEEYGEPLKSMADEIKRHVDFIFTK